MYTYHVFGVIEEIYYFMNNRHFYYSDYMCSEDKWLEDVYNITIKTTSDHIFERIKENNRYLSIEDKQYHYFKKIKIPKYMLKCYHQVLIRQHLFTGKFKEITTITTDIELRDGETIKINDREYRVEYKFNVDKKQHELYIDKVTELIVDEKLLKHAKIVCNEVIKKIIRYNKQVEKEMIKKNEETQTKATDTITDDETIQKDIDKTELKWYKKLWSKFKSLH